MYLNVIFYKHKINILYDLISKSADNINNRCLCDIIFSNFLRVNPKQISYFLREKSLGIRPELDRLIKALHGTF